MKETLCFLRKPQFEKNNPNFVWQSEKELVALSDRYVVPTSKPESSNSDFCRVAIQK